MDSQRKTFILSFLVVICLALTFLGAYSTYQQHKKKRLNTFNRQAESAIEEITRKIGWQMDSVSNTAVFINTVDNVSDEMFRAFTTPLIDHNPSIQALEWIPVVQHHERQRVEGKAQAFYPDFHFTERSPPDNQLITAKKRKTYFPVYFVNPIEGNEAAVGFDLASNEKRKKALEQAAHTGKMTISEPVTLVQEKKNAYGFLLFQPIYNKKDSHALRGFALGVFRIAGLFAALENSLLMDHIFLYDHTGSPNPMRLYPKALPLNSDPAINNYCLNNMIPIGQRQWQLSICMNDQQTAIPSISFIILCFGLLLTLILAAFVKALFNRQAIIETEVFNKTHALSKANEVIQRAHDAKSEFIAHMSHELRTPLNGISGAIDLLSETELKEKQRQFVGTAQYSINILLTVINEVLDFSKLESKKIELSLAPLDLKSFCYQMMEVASLEARKKQLSLKVDLPNASIRSVLVDQYRLKQILMNLITNAIKFTEHGYIRFSLAIDTDNTHAYICQFKIEDTGIGMSDAFLDNAFDKFAQDSLRQAKQYGGTGLGLTISKALTDLMGGTLLAENTDEGSLFTLTLPLKTTTKLAIAEKPAVKTNRRYDANILIVEDNSVNQFIAKSMLENTGIDVDIAPTGYEALEILNHKTFDLIFMDINMPGINGYETTAKIREKYGNETTIIALTANAQTADKDKCLQSGMNGFLKKPIQLRTLVNCLDEWLIATVV